MAPRRRSERAQAGSDALATDYADEADEHGSMQMGGFARPGTAAIGVISVIRVIRGLGLHPQRA